MPPYNALKQGLLKPYQNKEYLVNNFDLVRLLAAIQVMVFNHYFGYFKVEVDTSLRTVYSGVPIFLF